MADIIHEFTVKALPERVFWMFATPEGLDRWWTKSSSGSPREGEQYELDFGPGFEWHARVTKAISGRSFELEMHDSHPDWDNTRVGCEVESDGNGGSRVRFHHTGWPEDNEHWRVSCYCWAMYLRILRRYLEFAETVPYEQRLDA